MLKHIYSIPSIKVMSVETEVMSFTSANEATSGGPSGSGSLVPNGKIGTTENNDPNGSIEDDENQGAKGITFNFE